MVEWSEHVPTQGSVELPPEPRAMDAIGRNHSLETALADLVDNSIDAGAKQVLIRLVRANGIPRSLYVVDNGRGMTPDKIDTAMTVGGQRSYNADDLGRFGVGLKAASFSQARSLTVLSRAAGQSAVGRRWRLDVAMESFHCDIVAEDYASREIESDWDVDIIETGTVVRWDEVGAFPQGSDRVEPFITHTMNAVSNHLGMVFHRLIEKNKVTILFEVQDAELPAARTRVTIDPINPFGYLRSGHSDFPQELTATTTDVKVTFRCHIWPGRSNLLQFKLPEVRERQGLYFYRRDRLLQAGGWDGIHAPDPKLQLARVEVDIDDDMVGLFRMNPEKSRVLVGPEFARLCEVAQSASEVSFNDYLTTATNVFRAATKRNNSRKPMTHPGAGLPPRLKDTIKSQIPPRGVEQIDIRWRKFEADSFFEVDRDTYTIWLNKRYRKMLLGTRRGGLNDLPLLKTLIYLLVENLFQGDRFGARDKDNLELWQELLTTAAQAERQ